MDSGLPAGRFAALGPRNDNVRVRSLCQNQKTGRVMRRAASVTRANQIDAAKVIDRVQLDADDRHRRRIALTGQNGTSFLLDLPQATALRDGDGLVLDDGT